MSVSDDLGTTAGVPAPDDETRGALLDRRPADIEMARVLKTEPLQIAAGADPSQSVIAHWRHGALHNVVEPMSDHVIMTYANTMQRLERRSGRTYAAGTARPGVVTIIPAGSSARWDIAGNVDVIQLYLRPKTLARVAAEAGHRLPGEVRERTGYDDIATSRLLMMAIDALDADTTLDTLFRQQLTELIATRLLMAHTGSSSAPEAVSGGLSPVALKRALERLRSEATEDVSIAALASDAGISRFHFCRAFKKSTGLSPHAWLRQHQLQQAKVMLRDPAVSIVSIASGLGYSSQTAFAAAFRKLTGETPTGWRRHAG